MSRKRLNIRDIRNLERESIKNINDNSVYLPNPSVQAPFDRRSSEKVNPSDFGKRPSMERIFDLPSGDAGASLSFFRKIHAFYSLTGPTDNGRVGAQNYTKALPIITTRSANQNSKYWHVSVFGTGVRRPYDATLLDPLTENEIRSDQFEQYFIENPAGTFIPLSPRFVPSVTASQIRVMVNDESGQRFFDADVIGNRSFSLYGWGVTVFLLVKPDGYEVNSSNPEANTPLTGNFSGVEDDSVGGRIVGIRTNRTQSYQNRSLSISIDPAAFPLLPRIIPIPPGSRSVQIFSNTALPEAFWNLKFWYGRALSSSRPDVGNIDWNVGQSRTEIVEIPNAPSIAITPTNLGPITGFSLVFEVEP